MTFDRSAFTVNPRHRSGHKTTRLAASFSRSGASLNIPLHKRLGEPTRLRILIDPANKRALLEPSTDDDDSYAVSRGRAFGGMNIISTLSEYGCPIPIILTGDPVEGGVIVSWAGLPDANPPPSQRPGPTLPRIWTEEDDRILIESGDLLQVVADRLDRTLAAVYQRRKHLRQSGMLTSSRKTGPQKPA